MKNYSAVTDSKDITTKEYVDAGLKTKLDSAKLPQAIDEALTQAKTGGDFDGNSFIVKVAKVKFNYSSWKRYSNANVSWSISEIDTNGLKIGDSVGISGIVSEDNRSILMLGTVTSGTSGATIYVQGKGLLESLIGKEGPRGPKGDAGKTSLSKSPPINPNDGDVWYKII